MALENPRSPSFSSTLELSSTLSSTPELFSSSDASLASSCDECDQGMSERMLERIYMTRGLYGRMIWTLRNWSGGAEGGEVVCLRNVFDAPSPSRLQVGAAAQQVPAAVSCLARVWRVCSGLAASTRQRWVVKAPPYPVPRGALPKRRAESAAPSADCGSPCFSDLAS